MKFTSGQLAYLFLISFFFLSSSTSMAAVTSASEKVNPSELPSFISKPDLSSAGNAKEKPDIIKAIADNPEQKVIKEEVLQDMAILKDLASENDNPFHIPYGLKTNVTFWKNIYSKYKTNEVVIHDNRHLDIIYSVLTISNKPDPDGSKYRSKAVRKLVKKEKRKYSKILRTIHNKKRKKQTLTEEEQKVAKLLDSIKGNKKYLTASKNIRSQLGLRDRFLEGIKRSGKYIKDMERVFKKFGLPVELTALPHVESSFNYAAYSSAGAVGVWQFMRSTGRMFMRVDYIVDERRDPVASTVAAAKLLKRNYKHLGNWPMAIIAYNHGLSGMKRAKKRLGNGVVDIIKGYKSRLFGFASKNFYSEFLAALDIHQNTEKYFGKVKLHTPARYGTLPIKSFVHINTISKHLKLNIDTIKKFNPALRKPVVRGEKLIPKGYVLRYPLQKDLNLNELYASIPASQLKKKQIRSDWHRVRRGDSLYTIARRNKTTVSALLAMNEIKNPGRIYAGQVLKLPSSANKKQMVFMSKKKKITPTKTKISPVSISKKITPKKDTSLKKIYEVFSPAPANAENLEFAYIKVAPEETIGHYADWSRVSAKHITKLNKIWRRKPIVIGQTIKIPLLKVSKEVFDNRRGEYMRGLQEDFFSTYKIDGKEKFIVERGDSLWKICMDNDIPFWVLSRFNPEKNFQKLHAGDSLNMPVISRIN